MQEYVVKVYPARTEWYKNGLLDREDGPAIEYKNGVQEWYKNGKPHNPNGPAVVFQNGDKVWYKNGLLDREDGPAIEYKNGVKEWWIEGQRYAEKHVYEQVIFELNCIRKGTIELRGKTYRLVPLEKD